MNQRYIVTNFAYGTGPYIRTTELAFAFNDELELRGRERMQIIVPLVYGEKQKSVMREEFSSRMDEIVFDEKLGALLKSIFYGDMAYDAALTHWIENAKMISRQAHEYLSKFKIAVEINRSPRITYNVAPSYFTSFGYVADILRGVGKPGAEIADWVEADQKLHAIAYPGTFSWSDDYRPRYPTEFLAPPISRLYQPNNEKLEPGIFVTITGIPGLEHLYQDARRLGLKLYSNDTHAVPGSIKKLPHVIPNKNIVFQFARSGWSSVWLSMISGTPLVVPEFDPADDPEIKFNNIAVENLGIGIIYRGQPLEEILERREKLEKNSKALCEKILARFGTLDGVKYCARIFVEDLLKK